jgi:hypothetical protein
MPGKKREPSAAAAVLVGLLALASAMGIGRFSLTPILPLMQQDAGLTLTAGGSPPAIISDIWPARSLALR